MGSKEKIGLKQTRSSKSKIFHKIIKRLTLYPQCLALGIKFFGCNFIVLQRMRTNISLSWLQSMILIIVRIYYSEDYLESFLKHYF